MSTPLHITQYLRDKLEIESLQELRLQRVSGEKLESAIIDARLEWSRDYMIPEKRASTFRPILTPSTFSQLDEVVLATRGTLLCNSIAIAIPDAGSFGRRFFRILMLLEPAIDSDLVILVPEAVTGRVDTYADAWFEENVHRAQKEENGRRDLAERFAAGVEVAWNLDFCASFPNKFDLACVTPDQTNLIREILEISDATIPSSMASSHDQLKYLHQVVSTPFPMVNLPISDMIRVRQDGVFDAWREAVDRGFEKMNRLDQDQLLDPASVQLATIRESLEDAASQVRRQLNKSSVLRNSIGKSTGFALSVTCGALGSMGGPIIGAASAGVGFLGGALVEWLGGRPGSGDRAFKRLIIQVFGDPTV